MDAKKSSKTREPLAPRTPAPSTCTKTHAKHTNSKTASPKTSNPPKNPRFAPTPLKTPSAAPTISLLVASLIHWTRIRMHNWRILRILYRIRYGVKIEISWEILSGVGLRTKLGIIGRGWPGLLRRGLWCRRSLCRRSRLFTRVIGGSRRFRG